MAGVEDQFFVWLANTLSIFVVAYAAVPFMVCIAIPNRRHFVWGITVLVAPVAAEVLKRLTTVLGMEEWCRRPQDARDCDTWNRGGPQRGAGFPSGHTATAAAFWMGVVLLVPSWSMAVLSIVAVGIMAWARMQKGCHTLLQTIGGAVLGGGLALGIVGIPAI